MSSVIQVESISKSYLIQHKQSAKYRSIREEIMFGLNNVIGRRQSSQVGKQVTDEVFWALDDVSFSIGAGERVGVIGRNGAGKSTLLKILSRITKPTKGKIQLVGKLGSLLEVGTGFHPELTGRENIYLNGAILGMGSAEIKSKFDEIVEFAEIEKFLDTPVKRYSSGMYVKLAFSVAAHLEPDLLILDEVLAVGDQRFQKKCFDQIRKLGKDSGRAVILVSHNMSAISQICSRCLLLDKGRLVADGETNNVLAQYALQDFEMGLGDKVDLSHHENREGNAEKARVSWLQIATSDDSSKLVYIGSDLLIRFSVNFFTTMQQEDITLAVEISTTSGYQMANMLASDSGFKSGVNVGEYVFEVHLDDVRFYPGEYSVNIWIGDSSSSPIDYVIECGKFEVSEGGDKVFRRLPSGTAMQFLTPKWKLSTI
ncbi:polysaccharide ABC transporter ATP-binding protein [Methylotenera mobilis]|uniref:ABC transporter related n=1 Tax=Methylotenera mobilis (strain JLW8 / ATCC BAA-1282 / DSM 17540) TaxID=583345 RepID=C6WVI9_METML|nr:ABC transporter ATP-binding protein [Methylotenera mobilis]ACT47938.1 ABC transporter related [Methylotenera mobilis JLW8]